MREIDLLASPASFKVHQARILRRRPSEVEYLKALLMSHLNRFPEEIMIGTDILKILIRSRVFGRYAVLEEQKKQCGDRDAVLLSKQ